MSAHSIERDAARYRWLRDTQNTRRVGVEESDEDEDGAIDPIFVWDGYGCATALDGDEFDAAIDAAMERGEAA